MLEQNHGQGILKSTGYNWITGQFVDSCLQGTPVCGNTLQAGG